MDADGRTPLVSLVMPVWNPRRDWLDEAVGSALAEQEVEFELILVDDGCESPVAGLVSHVDDPRMIVLRVPHGGVSHARNAGLAAARGRYVRFLDSDDVVEPGSTARLVALADGRDDVIPYGWTIRCDPTLTEIGRIVSRIEGDATEACLLSRFDVRHVAMLFPRAVIDASGDWDVGFPACGDWDFVLRALEHAPVRAGAFVAARYRNHPGSVSNDVAACEVGMQRVVARWAERHPEEDGSRLHRRAEAQVQLKLGRSYVDRGLNAEGIRRLRTAGALDSRLAASAVVPTLSRLAKRSGRILAARTVKRVRRVVGS
jgi:GT2 family glycosyltransferase